MIVSASLVLRGTFAVPSRFTPDCIHYQTHCIATYSTNSYRDACVPNYLSCIHVASYIGKHLGLQIFSTTLRILIRAHDHSLSNVFAKNFQASKISKYTV